MPHNIHYYTVLLSGMEVPTLGPRGPPTNYGTFVVDVLGRMTRESGAINQGILRQCLGLSSSYLMTDVSMNPERGIGTWSIGFNYLVDALVALHSRGELELDTVSEASKACSECWSVASSWRGFDECRECVRAIAAKLKRLLDENGRTFGGERVYVP